MVSQNRITIIVFVGILALFVLIAFFRDISLKKNFKVTTGYIYDFGGSRKSANTLFFKFRFSVHNGSYTGNSSIPCAEKNRIHFLSWTNRKKVQVVYDATNPNNSHLLLTREDYNKYRVDIPEEYKAQTELIDSVCHNN